MQYNIRKFISFIFKPAYIYIASIILIGLFLAFRRIYISDYFPMNGDFQSYNVFRRLLGGQILYHDFSNYLGMGIVVLNMPFLLIARSFTASLFSTNFTAYICYAVMITLILYLLIQNKKVVFLFGLSLCLLPICLSMQGKVFYPFSNLYTPGNSMRVERAFLPYFISIIAIISLKITKKDLLVFFSKKKFAVISGSLIGFLIPWSNDFGFACFASFFIVYGVILLINKQKNSARKICFLLVIYAVTALIAFIASAFLITAGHPLDFFSFIKGVADYQFWYYGAYPGKVCSIAAILKNTTFVKYVIFFLLLSVFYLYKAIKNIITTKDILFCFINISTFFAALIYIYGSGGFSYEAFALSLFVTVFALSYNLVNYIFDFRILLSNRFTGNMFYKMLLSNKFINSMFYKKNAVSFFCLYAVIIYSLYLALGAFLALFNERPAPYSNALKGYSSYAETLENAKEAIAHGGGGVFSTYAGALETITGQYQPSGTDYIIHVLGDKQREAYMQNFLKGNYEYAQTIRNDFSPWESWVKRANWFWYRELYLNYKPATLTAYSVIWEKRPAPFDVQNDITVELNQIDERSYEIVCKSNNKEDIIADVSISYDSTFYFNLKRMQTYKKQVFIVDDSMSDENTTTWHQYNLPPKAKGYFIPVAMQNGAGRVVISTIPASCTKLTINNINVERVLPNYHYSLDYNKQEPPQ